MRPYLRGSRRDYQIDLEAMLREVPSARRRLEEVTQARTLIEIGSDTLSSWTDAGSGGNSAASVSNHADGAVVDARSRQQLRLQRLIANKCGDCHGRVGASAGLDLTSDNLAARVSGKKGTLACASYALIDTARPERSALYLKVTADAGGSRMPLGVTLTDGEQMCILDWIAGL